MGVCVYFMGFLPVNDLPLLILQIFAGIIIYIAISAITKNENLIYIMDFAKDFLRRGKKKDA